MVPLNTSVNKSKRSDKNVNDIQKSLTIDKDDSFKSPYRIKTTLKKKAKSKVINIMPKTKSDIDKSDYGRDRELLDEFEAILSSEINDFKILNYDRVSPNLIIKFSKCFDKIIQH